MRVLHRPNATDQHKAIQGFSKGKPEFTFLHLDRCALNLDVFIMFQRGQSGVRLLKRYIIMSNANQNTNPFLAVEMAGKDVAIAQQDAARSVMSVAVETIKKNVHTKEDAKAFLTGYADQIATTNKDSVKSLKSRMARIVKVLIVSDDKLNEFHKLSKPADGQKLIAKLSKKCDGLKPLYDALAIPSAEPVTGEGDGEGDSESEPTEKDAKDLATLWSTFYGDAMTNGHTKDDINAFVATVLAS